MALLTGFEPVLQP